MNACVKHSGCIIPSTVIVNSNQSNYTHICSTLNSQVVKNITNLYSRLPTKKLFKSSIFWTEHSDCSHIEQVNEYKSFLGSRTSNNTVISPRIWKYNEEYSINNNYFNKFLNTVLLEIISLLNSTGKNGNIHINIETVVDIEFSDWEEFVISLKILPKNTANYEEYYKLWDEMVDKVTELILLSDVKDEKILKKYGNPMIVFDMYD
jgi:hypothetical protein